MEIEIFTLCDYAQDIQGKLIIVGTFDVINTKTIPATHPACSVVCRIRFAAKEAGTHSIRFTVTDESSKNIAPEINGNIEVRQPQGTDHTVANLIINFNQMKFEKAGKYFFQFFMDGEWLRGLSLTVNNKN